MSLEEYLKAYENAQDYIARSEFQNRVAEEAADFLLEHVPQLADVTDRDTLVAGVSNCGLSSEQLDVIAQAPIDTQESAVKFSILLKSRRNLLGYFRIFHRFLRLQDITRAIQASQAEVYSVSDAIVELLAKQWVKEESWLIDIVTIAFGDTQESEHAYKALFGRVLAEFNYVPETYAHMVSRLQNTLKSNASVGSFNPAILSRLSDICRKTYLLVLQNQRVDEEHWLTLDKKLKPLGLRACHLPGDPSDTMLDYLKSEIYASNNVEWLAELCRNLKRSGGKTYSSLLQQALKDFQDKIDFSCFGDDHCRGIDDRQLIECIFDRCHVDGQKRLARNYEYTCSSKGDYSGLQWALVERYADLFAQQWFDYGCSNVPQEMMVWYWERVQQVKSKHKLLQTLSCNIAREIERKQDVTAYCLQYVAWYNESPQDYDSEKSFSVSFYEGVEDVSMALRLWPDLGPKIRTYITEQANHYFNELNSRASTCAPLLKYVAEHNLELAINHEDKHWGMLAYLTNASFTQLLDMLEPVEKSAAAVPHLARGLANVDCDRLQEQGFYTYPKKNIRDAAQWSLVYSLSPKAGEVIRVLLTNKKAKLDDARYSYLLDKLESLGSAVDELDPFSPDTAAEYCEAKLSATLRNKLSRLWGDHLTTLWGENPQILEYALCVLAMNTWGGVPRFTRQCFGLLSEARRRQMTTAIVEAWAQGKADKADFWVLDLLEVYADENTVPLLQKLVQQWHKQYRMRAAMVVKALGKIDTAFSLSACDEFYKKSKYADDVRTAAYEALTAAAQRRDIKLAELYDELVPTFGLEEGGLTLDVGPRTYIVTLKSTLDLSVVDQDSGRVYKNLPKTKADEDTDLRAAADSQFKLLKKNLKPAIKALHTRFTESFESGQSWRANRWKTLFLSHPILSLVGQGFVWQVQDQDQQYGFRISEDLSLIDWEDNEVVLNGGEVTLMHPAEVEADLLAKWKSHFDDYEISSFLDQFHRADLSDVDWDKKELTLFRKKPAEYGKLKRLMEKHNFTVYDGDGSWIASYRRYYLGAGWAVHIDMEECRVYMSFDEEAEIGDISFYHKKECVPVVNVPRRLVATVVKLMTEMCR